MEGYDSLHPNFFFRRRRTCWVRPEMTSLHVLGIDEQPPMFQLDVVDYTKYLSRGHVAGGSKHMRLWA